MIPAATIAQQADAALQAATPYVGGFGDLTDAELQTFPHYVVEIIEVADSTYDLASPVLANDRAGTVTLQVTVRHQDVEAAEVSADRIRLAMLDVSNWTPVADTVYGYTPKVCDVEFVSRFADADRSADYVRHTVSQRFACMVGEET